LLLSVKQSNIKRNDQQASLTNQGMEIALIFAGTGRKACT